MKGRTISRLLRSLSIVQFTTERETELGEDIINSLDKETESSNCLGHFRKKREEIISFRDSSLQILVLEILLSLIINQG